MTGASRVASGPGGILGFDLSSVVGWAYGHAHDTHPACGTWHLSGPLGQRFGSFENELIRTMGERLPRLVVMEAPLPGHSQKSMDAARQQFGLAAYVESECYRAGVTVKEGNVGEVRKVVLGKGSYGSSEANKAKVMEWCHQQGWHPPDHNAGDALVLWKWSTQFTLPKPSRRLA